MIDEVAGRHQDRRSPGGRQVGDRLVPIEFSVVPELEKRRQTNQFFVVERRAAVVPGPFAIGRLSGIALRFTAQGFRRNAKDGIEDDLTVLMMSAPNDGGYLVLVRMFGAARAFQPLALRPLKPL